MKDATKFYEAKVEEFGTNFKDLETIVQETRTIRGLLKMAGNLFLRAGKFIINAFGSCKEAADPPQDYDAQL